MLLDRNHIFQLILGIRFEPSFRLGDITGSIFDSVLHDEQSPFGTDFFPSFQAAGDLDRALINEEKEHFLRITTSDIILKYSIQDKAEIAKELKWFRKDATGYLIDKVFKAHRIGGIVRVGFVINHTMDELKMGSRALDKLTSGSLKTVDQFMLRFGNKDVTAVGLTKQGVNDYVNRIATVREVPETLYEATMDLQYYFLPSLPSLHEWDISAFFEKALTRLDQEFYPLIDKVLGELVETR